MRNNIINCFLNLFDIKQNSEVFQPFFLQIYFTLKKCFDYGVNAKVSAIDVLLIGEGFAKARTRGGVGSIGIRSSAWSSRRGSTGEDVCGVSYNRECTP